MSSPLRPAAVALGLLALAACATLAQRRTPTDQDVILQPHARHRAAEIDCRACHARIYTATALPDGARLLPEERVCLKCHGDWKDEGRCGACHLTPEPQTYPPRERRVRVSHKDHLARTGDDCGKCHLDLPEPGRPVRPSAPMGACLACHHHKREYDQARCTPCHIDLSRVPLRPVAYFSHQGNYVKEHRLPARTAPLACAQCHDQEFCADCHARTAPTTVEFKLPERVDRQFIHRNDYVSRHAIEARADEALCLRCHSTKSCERCHRDVGLSPSADPLRDPHPQGWATPGSPRFHGPPARRDIVTCAGCHDQGAGANCVRCHRVGGVGGNPHPPSFRKSHDREEIRTNAMCRACHP